MFWNESIWRDNITTADMTIASVSLSSKFVATQDAYAMINIIYGNEITAGDYLVLTFSDEFIRNDAGTSTCLGYNSGVISKTCTFSSTNNVITSVLIKNICATTCNSWDTYIIKL